MTTLGMRPAMNDTDMRWMENGRCVDSALEEWVPNTLPLGKRARMAFLAPYARECAACPVLLRCDKFARENREYGIWAGTLFDDGNPAYRTTGSFL